MKELIFLLTTIVPNSLPLVLILDRTQCWNCTTSTPQVCHCQNCHLHYKDKDKDNDNWTGMLLPKPSPHCFFSSATLWRPSGRSWRGWGEGIHWFWIIEQSQRSIFTQSHNMQNKCENQDKKSKVASWICCRFFVWTTFMLQNKVTDNGSNIFFHPMQVTKYTCQ